MRPPDHSSRLVRGELSDAERAERLEAEDADGYMGRSGYLERLGYKVPKASFDQIFRDPDGVKKALRASTSP